MIFPESNQHQYLKSFLKLIFYTKNYQPTANKGLFIVNVDKVNVDTESLII